MRSIAESRAAWLLTIALLAASTLKADLRPRSLPGVRAEAATLIVQGLEGGALPVAATILEEKILAVETEAGDPRLRVPVAIEVATAGLADDDLTLEFYVYAFSAAGAVVAHTGLAIDLPSGRLEDRPGVKLLATLDLPVASHSFRFLVLDPASHRFGLRRQLHSVGGGVERLTRPRLEEPCPGLIVASTPEAPPSTSATLPVLRVGSRIRLLSTLSEAAEGLSAEGLTVHLRPTSAGEATGRVLEANYRVGDGLSGQPAPLEIDFELPAVGRGVYELTLHLEGSVQTIASPATAAWIVDSSDLASLSDPCAVSWTGVIAHSLGRAAYAGTATPGATLDETGTRVADRDQKITAGGLRRAYSEVLRGMATSGGVAQAAEELAAVEERFFEHASQNALLRNEMDVARKLVRRHPEVLAPLMMLHHRAYEWHYRRQRLALAAHSRRVVQLLAELLEDRRRRGQSHALAAHILTSLAELGHRRQTYSLSQLLLQDALELEPDSPDALLLLAVNYEWFGRYEDASRRLTHLVDLDATHREGRVRLGMMRLRVGDAVAAERHFRRVLREGAQPWLLSLTYQALAELLGERENYSDAVELLEQGRSRLATDQRLHLLNAYALERTGRRAEARDLLAELPIDGSLGTPRFRYGESLTGPLDSLRNAIDIGVAVRLPLLARALGAESLPEPGGQ